MRTEATKREAGVLLQALSAGVVPRVGLRHIAVGRQREVEALVDDLELVENGGAAFRFVVGRYGSGKSFLIQLIRNYAMEKKFVVMDADLSPERRLAGTKGQGLGTYRELVQHISIQSKPDGGAMESVLQTWIASIQREVAQKTGVDSKDVRLVEMVSDRIKEDMRSLTEMAHGFAFSEVLDVYWRAVKTGNDEQKQVALRWLRGEFANKTAARNSGLNVDSVITDGNWYDFLKLFAAFTKKAGFKGLVVYLDEGVNLYKIQNKISRSNNYEKLLTMYNDCMQGKAHNIAIIMSGTDQFVYDESRGLFSYEALRSRLNSNNYLDKGYVDYSAPVLMLKRISDEELFVLLERLRDIHAKRYGYEAKLSSADLEVYLNFALSRIGADEFLTPREITKMFIEILNILEQHPEASFYDLISTKGNDLKGPDIDPDALNDDIFAELDDL
jgi:hypothetical protein